MWSGDRLEVEEYPVGCSETLGKFSCSSRKEVGIVTGEDVGDASVREAEGGLK